MSFCQRFSLDEKNNFFVFNNLDNRGWHAPCFNIMCLFKGKNPAFGPKGGFIMKGSKGFTLIEMLIVVAIIGILAALLIPNAMSAIQKAKQKGTVKDVNSIAAALMDYITDKGYAPTTATGQIAPNDGTVQALQGFYLKVMPIRDQWGNYFYIYGGTNCAGNEWGIPLPSGETEWGADEFMVGSMGRNGTPNDHSWVAEDLSLNLYQVNSMADFNKEIVNWNGNLVIGPRTAGATGTT